MKSLPASVLFLFIFYTPTANSAPMKSTYRTRLVDALNIFREELSIGLDIANMQEVVFDEELEKEGQTFESCDDIKHGANYRVRLMHRLEGVHELEQRRPVNGTDIKQTGIPPAQLKELYSEFLHPLNSRVACVRLKTKCPFEPRGQPEAGAVCLFGMHNSYPMKKWKRGPPGSRCPNGKVESGLLCKAVD